MNINKNVVEILLKDAIKALKIGEIPVSAVIIDQEGNVISSAFNTRQNNFNVMGHAEINAILKAEKKIRDWRLDGYSMVVTLEPCNMCSIVIDECRLDKVFYFLPNNKGNISREIHVDKEQVVGYDDYKVLFKELLTFFFNNKR